MITNFDNTNSIISEWIREIRDTTIQVDRMRFRRNLERLGEIAGYEISKTLQYEEVLVSTPLGETNCKILKKQPVIVSIMRAGLPLYNGLLNVFDKADSSFIGAYRKHSRNDDSFEIYQQYLTSPELAGRPLIIADPMLATGASLNLAISTLVDYDLPSEIHVVTAIACSVGIELLIRHYPNIHIWTGAIDEELTAKGYIVPGLGDAGDLCFGNKRQS